MRYEPTELERRWAEHKATLPGNLSFSEFMSIKAEWFAAEVARMRGGEEVSSNIVSSLAKFGLGSSVVMYGDRSLRDLRMSELRSNLDPLEEWDE